MAGAGPSASSGEADEPIALSHLLGNLDDAEGWQLLRSLLDESRPEFNRLYELLQDETTCTLVLRALQELATVVEARWGKAAAEHECSLPTGCLRAVAEVAPELLDEMRARMIRAKEGAESKRTREELLPTRKASKLRHQDGARARSAVQQRAELAMADFKKGVACETPEEAAEFCWASLRARGCCTGACQAMCGGFVGTSKNFGNKPLVSRQGSSRVAAVERPDRELLSAEAAVEHRCCEADCSPSLTVAAVMGIRARWAKLKLSERLPFISSLMWDDALSVPRPWCDVKLCKILGMAMEWQ